MINWANWSVKLNSTPFGSAMWSSEFIPSPRLECQAKLDRLRELQITAFPGFGLGHGGPHNPHNRSSPNGLFPNLFNTRCIGATFPSAPGIVLRNRQGVGE